ncbi:simple sugar transport system ATP-binding protein/ribose transport system ATP-binding protein [Roseiarcus fermentans]|uniref:Simple sugar transport system ATP-binding protein/ribose transport system ATP-binding protein n=1 Tax=Roseiarcus fermentans TaxID=1473586 RepID=A0A366FRV5_9HYPH|nr:sugar ABC transporter ATP-binding protein [Roseiarcus fermentans]RBP16790.1 simple sugar transport system ATP-binding protein/ribose transport system ATP-binding protein [Roseiarcus fermentans]
MSGLERLTGGRPDEAARPAPAIEFRSVSHRYGRIPVLADVAFAVAAGSVAGLIGENGAGKTTLFNILSGLAPLQSGALRLRGAAFAPRSYREAVEAGVSRVFQEQALIPALPVYENLLIGQEHRFERAGFRNRRAMIARAEAIAHEAEIDVDVRRPAGDYPFSVRQALEIARACLAPSLVLGIENPIVLLDEPTSALSVDEEAAFFRLLGRLKGRATLVFVSHRLNEVLKIADRVHVLKDGRLTASRRAGEVDESELHRLMVGRERGVAYYRQRTRVGADGAPVLAVRKVSRAGAFREVSFSVGAGEIVGVGGLLRSGKSRLGRAVAGVEAIDGGAVEIAGAARRSAVAYVPSERTREGVIGAFDIARNIGLGNAGRLTGRLGFWRARRETALAEEAIRTLDIRASGPAQRVATLSGGNQQKVVIARWAVRKPRLLVVDNPTRGVDAGARAEIYAILRRLTDQGAGVLMISDDLPELIGLSDRVLVMREGRLVAERAAPVERKPQEEDLVALMIGLPAADAPHREPRLQPAEGMAP